MAEIRKLIRLLNSDLEGDKQVLYALRGIKGVNTMFVNAVLSALKIKKTDKLAELPKERVKEIEEAILNPGKLNIPSWIYNRRRDPETGEDHHITTTKLFLANQEDIKIMKKIKCYKGVRHILGLPVRGQRTRSNFRKNKKRGAKLGVSVKKIKKGKV